MSIIAETQGLYDTIQDAGRPGYRSFGVPLGGWFDDDSATRANALAGNEPESPCLEITLRSGCYRALSRIRIAIAGPGAVIEVFRNAGVTHTWRESVATTLSDGDSFRIHHPAQGLRSYVAVAGGGWAGRAILGSESSEQRIRQGMRLSPRFEVSPDLMSVDHLSLAPWRIAGPGSRGELPFVTSTEFERLTHSADRFASISWTMSDRSDRVGLRFVAVSEDDGKLDVPLDPARLSEPVVPGTIQWTGSELIVLGVAGGTMGGYPVLGYVARSVVSELAQIRPGDIVRLCPVSLDAAWLMTESHDQELRKSLNRIRLAVAGR